MAEFDKTDRWHAENQRRIYKKIRKPVRWNGMTFECASALARHLKLCPRSVSGYIYRKIKLQGYVPMQIKKD